MPSQEFREQLFACPDPWSYDDLYERTKRRHTLELIEGHRFESVLEMGCAEGFFTEELASVTSSLLAIDISRTALERARIRCASHSNVTFDQLDAFEQLPEGHFDLVVCAEILCYTKNRFALARLARGIRERVQPDGFVLLTHPNGLADRPDQSGMDLHEIGASFIGQTFARTPGLAFVRELRTAVYRAQLFQKSPGAKRDMEPHEVLIREAQVDPRDRAAGLVKWGGCIVTSAEARHEWRSPAIPILMYHRIAPAGPENLAPYRVHPRDFERQLAYLQRQGYRSVGLSEAYAALQSTSSPKGRVVAITFDDAYRDFFDCAWPLLRAYGFTATMFVPVGFVGGSAGWDRSHGEPAELMSWDQIRAAQKEGAVFGSHSMTHRRLTTISESELLTELSESKARLETMLGTSQELFSYPFGQADEAVLRTTAACGYRHAVLGEGLATREANPYCMPRQEILGHFSIEQFVGALGSTIRAPWSSRLRYRWLRLLRDRRTYLED
jgi:peptidoglycan/xylan/chitin deacetylase (PgdA/CDA1 family)